MVSRKLYVPVSLHMIKVGKAHTLKFEGLNVILNLSFE